MASLKPRPHADLIKAWADGATIQIKHKDSWVNIPLPSFFEADEYRIKPVEKVFYATVAQRTPESCPEFFKIMQDDGFGWHTSWGTSNLKLVMDDEGKLISAEVI